MVSTDDPIRNITLSDLLCQTASLYPDRSALIYADADIRQTWREFASSVDNLAKSLHSLGVRKGSKVAVWATNVPYWIDLMFAVARIGAILVTINPNFRSNELTYVLKQSDADTLFVIENYKDHDFLSILYAVIPELLSSPAGDLNSKSFPCLKRVCLLGGSAEYAGLLSYDAVLKCGSSVSDSELEEISSSVHHDDVVNMQYTSGTTGFPKGVMLTHKGIGNNGFWIGENQKLTSADTVCIPVPLFHCFGCVLGVLACVSHGSAMVILESYNPTKMLEMIEKEHCTACYGVPTMFLGLLEHNQFSKYDLGSLRTGIMSGSVCPEPLMRRVVESMHMSQITIPYGLTENSPVMTMTTTNETLEDRCQTVGKAMPGIEVTIINPENGERLPVDTSGEVCCRGYSVMKGYYKDDAATAEVIDKNGWLHTGDLGMLDERGYLHITGRIKDMIVRGGENIYPREIEEFLLNMPQVSDVQIVSVPSRRYGEEIAAFIIPQKDMTVTISDIRAFCRGNISWYKIPRYIHCLESFPMTANGKIQKYKLRELALKVFKNVK